MYVWRAVTHTQKKPAGGASGLVGDGMWVSFAGRPRRGDGGIFVGLIGGLVLESVLYEAGLGVFDLAVESGEGV